MKCEDVSKELIAYLDRRASSAERRMVEEHVAECGACRMRAEEFRKLWSVMDEMPVVEPSLVSTPACGSASPQSLRVAGLGGSCRSHGWRFRWRSFAG